jgi:hypothetical protein
MVYVKFLALRLDLYISFAHNFHNVTLELLADVSLFIPSHCGMGKVKFPCA